MSYSDRFIKFIIFVLDAETTFKKGHYGDDKFVVTEHDPNDSGGATRYGIDKSSHQNVDVEHLTKAGATDIYWDEWQKEGIESLPYPFGECYYDCCVNAGIGRARSITKVTGQDATKFLAARAIFYKKLAFKVKKDRQYLQGWLNRIDNVKKYLNI